MGRLDAQPRVLREADETTIVGLLTDESGLPVSGEVEPVQPKGVAFASCLPRTAARTKAAVVVDESGRFCLRGTLPSNADVVLRLSADGYRTRDLTLSPTVQLATPPRILTSPEVVDLDSPTNIQVTAGAVGALEGEELELRVECHGEKKALGRARASAGEARFEIAPRELPGPGACTFVVSASADSVPRPVVLQARATLESTGWTTSGGRARAVIRASLRWRDQERPLDIGVLEGNLDSKHRLTVPLFSGGEGRLELDEPPTSSISLRLIRSPVYARPPEALTLPPPTKWPGWRVLEAASLLGLAVWLLFSWRSTEQKSTPVLVPGSPGVPRSAPTGPLAGRVTDAHTGHPIAASVRIFTVGPASEELALSVQAASDGSFRFTRPSGVCRFRAAADGYLELDGPLPAGPAAIRLVSRRRAALSLLASWFRGRTPDGPVPTPQEVGRSARSTGRAGVAEWAEEVARAAYAASPPSDADLSALAERKPS